MKIEAAVFRRKRRHYVFRILLMAFCALSLYLVRHWTTWPDVVSYIFVAITAALAMVASFVAVKPIPKNRTFQLKPDLIIPAPLLYQGLDTSSDPLVYWQKYKIRSSFVLFATNKRIGILEERWFAAEEWQLLLDNLPVLPANANQNRSGEISWPPTLLAAACALLYYNLPSLTNIEYFDMLTNGAYNKQLASSDQPFRVLSSVFVHSGELHLLINVMGLFMLGSVLGKGFGSRSTISLMIVSAILSVILGSLTTNASITVGASGVMMGLFGFIVAAQRNQDKRLHPINRIPRQKFLYLLLILEVVLSIKFKWYGGAVHLVGIASGYLYYRWFERSTESKMKQRSVQNAALFTGLALTLLWTVSTWSTFQHPEHFATKLLDLQDPGLTAIAGAALPDLPNASATAVRVGLANAERQLPHEELNSLAIARSNYWLGNTDAALVSLRELTGLHPKNDLLHPLWLAVERDAARQRSDLTPLEQQPAGHETTILISTDYQWVARLRLRNKPTPLEDISPRLARHNWYLAGVTNHDAPGSYGLWRMTERHYPTEANATRAH